jgi:hypothetical protein
MWRRLAGWLGAVESAEPARARPRVASARTPQRVLSLVFNPLIEREGGRRLSEILGWNEPRTLEAQYMRDLGDASGGMARYDVVEHRELDVWPRKRDGFRYTDESFSAAWRNRRGFHEPDGADYDAILHEFNIYRRIDRGEIDEVWLFGPPYAGFWESTMAGPGAYWCNSPPVAPTERCSRRFVVMGFNYERDVGCMLENFGHRTESIMRAVYEGKRGAANLWEQFCRYEEIAPGRASCGNVHFAPNSQRDYDWGNRRTVLSDCDAWLDFPRMDGARRPVDCREWGNGDMRAHHLWWFRHLPAAPGTTDGVSNNWWEYVLDPNY